MNHYFDITALLKKHYPAIVLGLIAGFIMVVPQLFFMWSLGDEFKGIQMMKSDGETYYVARMHGLYTGNGISSPYYFENNNDLPNIYFTFSEILLAVPGYVLGVSVTSLNLFYKFVLPSIVFLLVYFLCYRLTKRRMWSLAGASLVVMGNLLLSMPDLLHFLKLETVYSQFSLFSRAVNPEFSSIIFFIYLHLLLSAIRSDRRKWYIAMSLLFGASFYFYFYSWTFILTMNFCLLILFFFFGNLRPVSWKLILTTVAGLIFGARAIAEAVAVKMHPFIADLAGVYDIASHKPIMSLAGVLVSALFFWYFYTNKIREKEDYFLLGLLIATFAAVNQQVISGVSVQTGHYHWYFSTPIFIIVLVYLGAKRLNSIFSENLLKVIAFILILVSIVSASLVQYSSYIYNKQEVLENQDFSEVFDWLNKNTSINSIVLASESVSELVPVYTHNGVLDNYYGGTYLLSPERRAYTRDIALKDLYDNKKPLYRIDYIVWDTLVEPEWKINTIKIAKQETVIDRFKIYSILK